MNGSASNVQAGARKCATSTRKRWTSGERMRTMKGQAILHTTFVGSPDESERVFERMMGDLDVKVKGKHEPTTPKSSKGSVVTAIFPQLPKHNRYIGYTG
jgi:hypothetical protein